MSPTSPPTPLPLRAHILKQERGEFSEAQLERIGAFFLAVLEWDERNPTTPTTPTTPAPPPTPPHRKRTDGEGSRKRKGARVSIS